MYIIQRYLYIQRNTKIILSELTIEGRKSNRFDSSIFSFHVSVVKNVDYSRTSGQIVNEIGFVIKPENEKGQILLLLRQFAIKRVLAIPIRPRARFSIVQGTFG